MIGMFGGKGGIVTVIVNDLSAFLSDSDNFRKYSYLVIWCCINCQL